MTNSVEQIRVSWSLLEAWARGDIQQALSMMNGGRVSPNGVMSVGLHAHEVVSQNGLVHPEIKADAQFETIEAGLNRNKFVVKLAPWLVISGIPDIKVPSTHTLIDVKTGSRKSYKHKPMQLYVYAYALAQLGEDYRRGIIFKVDASGRNPLDYMVYTIGSRQKAQAEEYIYTYATDIFSFLNNNRLEAAAIDAARPKAY